MSVVDSNNLINITVVFFLNWYIIPMYGTTRVCMIKYKKKKYKKHLYKNEVKKKKLKI